MNLMSTSKCGDPALRIVSAATVVESDHAKLPQLQQFPPMKACFLVLEPHFCCQFAPCKLHPKNEASSNVPDVPSLRSVPVVQTVRCANYDASNLVAASRILGKNFPFDLWIPLIFSTKAKLPTATASDHRASRTANSARRSGESQRFIVSHKDARGKGDHWKK